MYLPTLGSDGGGATLPSTYPPRPGVGEVIATLPDKYPPGPGVGTVTALLPGTCPPQTRWSNRAILPDTYRILQDTLMEL